MAWSDWQSVGTKGVVLWENPDPTASFAAQTINLGDEYSGILVEYWETSSVSNYVYLNIPEGSTASSSYMFNGVIERQIQFQYGEKAYFTNATYTSDGQKHNTQIMPIRIIGFKKDIADV